MNLCQHQRSTNLALEVSGIKLTLRDPKTDMTVMISNVLTIWMTNEIYYDFIVNSNLKECIIRYLRLISWINDNIKKFEDD